MDIAAAGSTEIHDSRERQDTGQESAAGKGQETAGDRRPGGFRHLTRDLAISPTVSVVIPARNEARNLPEVLQSLPDWVSEVVLVDGHSADDTVAVAGRSRPGIKVLRQDGRGKGDAMIAGFAACTGDIVVMMDADGSTPAAEMGRFVAALVAGADYAKGSRFTSGGGSDDITPARRVGNRLLSGLVNRIFGTCYTDLCYGYNAIWARHLPALRLDCDGFEIETVMNIRAAACSLQVQEIPSHERPRVHGESNLHILADGWRILRAITREAQTGRPGSLRGLGTRRSPAHPIRKAAAGGRDTGPPAISVVICAYTTKRRAQTRAAVASVAAQSLAALETIVVVDHNPQLHAALTGDVPGATVIANAEEPGLSGSRNTGVAAARGDIVAFLDDDAIADPDWLKFLVDSYADPAVTGVGGRIVPHWRSRRPAWFPPEFDWVVGCTYRGLPPSRMPVRNLIGSNASFRREAFGLAGGFTAGIGRSIAGRPLGCEETEFCIRLRQRSPGSVLLFDNRAVVEHMVPAERSRFAYFWSRCYAEGLSKSQVTASVGTRDGLASERRYTFVTLPAGVARGFAETLRGDWSGATRAGAIVAGLAATTVGYGTGVAGRRGHDLRQATARATRRAARQGRR